MHFAVDDGVSVVGDELFTNRQPRVQAKALALGTGQPGFQADLPAFDIRRPSDALERRAGHHFHPDRLPDAGRAWVPDGVRCNLPVLLPTRFGEVMRVVFGTNDELDWRLVGTARDIERERRIAAFVSAEASTVDPHRGLVVDRAEMEQDPGAVLDRGQNERRTIPARAQERRVADAARGCLRRERHQDLRVPRHIPRMTPLGAAVRGEIPEAIERKPRGPLQLGSGIAPAVCVEITRLKQRGR